MEWEHKWAASYDKLVEIESNTGVTPKALEERPVLDPTSLEVLRAYKILDATRTYGLSMNPVQLSEMRAYIDLFGLPPVPVDVFVKLIGTLDQRHVGLRSGENQVVKGDNGNVPVRTS